MGKNRWRLSDFEANKAAVKAIVYQSVTGKIYIRPDDIAPEKQEFNKEYFLWLKNESDKIYLDIENGDHTERRYCYPYDDCSQNEDKSGKNPEEMIIRQEYLRETIPRLQAALDSLTSIQRRRIWLLSTYGYSIRKIADIENVSHVSVMRSINAARKKILKYLTDTGTKTM